MDETPEPKISLVVGILGLIITIILDILSFVPFVGDIEEIPVGLAFVLSLVFGASSPIMITIGIVMALKAIPAVQELPLWTAAWIVIWRIENHPSQVGEVIKEIAEAEAKAETGGGAEAEIGESAAATAATQTENVAATEAASAEVGAIEQEGAAAGGAGQKTPTETAETSADRGDTQKEAAEKAGETPSEAAKSGAETGEEEEAPEGGGETGAQEEEEEKKEDELEGQMETDEERPYGEIDTRDIFENVVPIPKRNEEGEETVPDKKPRGGLATGEEFRKRQVAAAEKRQLNAPKVGQEATGEQDRDDLAA